MPHWPFTVQLTVVNCNAFWWSVYHKHLGRQNDSYFYWLQRSWAKVISLQASVCPHGGGWGGVCSKFSGVGGVCSKIGGVSDPNFRGGVVSDPNFGGCLTQIFRGGVWNFFFFSFNLFTRSKNFFWDAHPPTPETVNARPVCILLECILV